MVPNFKMWLFYPEFHFGAKYILYFQDSKGDENFHFFSVNIETGQIKNLTNFPNTRVYIYKKSGAIWHSGLF